MLKTSFFRVTLFLLLFALCTKQAYAKSKSTWWEIQSIDTMKNSRDLAREKNTDKEYLEQIDIQVKNIAETGATHVAIATPYDEEFFPFLANWVKVARKYNLKIWFRGNWSGWEGWFDYPKISREEHIKKSVKFVKDHGNIFEDGDIFSACPECENGGNGDPRTNDDVTGHRDFLIEEYAQLKNAFTLINKSVKANFSPMNADVAKLIMDKETTRALGGIVVIDHYVKSAEKLNADVTTIAERSEGKVFLGEFGAPIPDIHGKMNNDEQAKWLEDTLTILATNENLLGVNYWVNIGGSTQIWNSENIPNKAVGSLRKYFSPHVTSGKLVNELGQPIVNATIENETLSTSSDIDGEFVVKYVEDTTRLRIIAEGYREKLLKDIQNPETIEVVLTKSNENMLFRIRRFIYQLLTIKSPYRKIQSPVI